VQQLRLHLSKLAFPADKQPDGPWGIVTDGNCGTELWHPAWKGRLVRYDEPASWKVTYTAERFLRWSMVDPPPIVRLLATMERDWAELRDQAIRIGHSE